MQQLVISFISQDKPGLVELLSKTIKQHQGNWQTSSLHHLSGFFAGIIEASVKPQQSSALVDALNKLDGFKITVELANNNQPAQSNKVNLNLTANDRQGIIQEISSVIRQQQGNLLALTSHQQSAPHSGQELFSAHAEISVKAEHLEALIDAIESLSDDLMVDISSTN